MSALEWRPKGLEDWAPKQSLKKHGENFTVEVVRWGYKEMDNANVYAYIRAGHPLFLRCEQSMWGCPFELEGLSFYELHKNEHGIITAHQYGNDYNHLWHEERGMNGDDKWQNAMWDAVRLFEQLSKEPRP